MGQIRCRIIFNASCLKCDVINKEMIRIGAFVFCQECWEKVFEGQESFTIEDTLYTKQYHEWLKVYKEEVNNNNTHTV